jgi:nucleotide-binding universal stress UspA family protein
MNQAKHHSGNKSENEEQTSHISGTIACATRGGEGSEPTVQGAIDLAQERELRLIFLYIADLEFMKHTTMGRTGRAAEELRKMGEFIMLTLVERAQQSGVEADFAVRQGRFREELLRYLEETRPAMLVLGTPQKDTGFFDQRKIARLAQEIEEQTGVPVKLVQGAENGQEPADVPV